MRGQPTLNWVIFQTTPSSRAFCLKDILQKKFPQHSFSYFRNGDSPRLLNRAQALIFEFKGLTSANLRQFDSLLRKSEKIPRIFIVTPVGYRLLRERRPHHIDNGLVILSDAVSLDYLLHIPRLVQEVDAKSDLTRRNEELRRLIQGKIQEIHSEGTEDVVDRLLDEKSGPLFRLRVTMPRWHAVAKALGSEIARTTLFETLRRSIAQSVRQSDQILHAKENEFLIYLNHTSEGQIRRCKERIQKSLAQIEIQANDRALDCPFKVVAIREA